MLCEAHLLAFFEDPLDIPPGLEQAADAAKKQRANFFGETLLSTGLISARLVVDGLSFVYMPVFNPLGSELFDIGIFDFSMLCYDMLITNHPSLEERSLAECKLGKLSDAQVQSRLDALRTAGLLNRLAKAGIAFDLSFYFLANQNAQSKIIDQVLAAYFFNFAIGNLREKSPAELYLNKL